MKSEKFLNIKRFLVPLVVSVLLLVVVISCANDYKRAPRGGEADKVAPEILEFFPVQGSLNQDQNIEVSIEFDEYLKFSSTKNAISISPITAFDKSEIIWGEKSVDISFTDLEKDETVLVIVNTSLTDLRGNSIADNFILNFSTGAYLDSAGISGEIGCSIVEDNIIIPSNPTNFKVLLYDYNELKDSLKWTKKIRPKYEIGVNKELKFSLQHVKEGSYLPLVFKNASGSKNFDLKFKDSYYTFGNEIVVLSRNEQKEYRYFLGKQDTISPYITDIRVQNIDLLEVEFSEKINFSLNNTKQNDAVTKSGVFHKITLDNRDEDSLLIEKNYYLGEKFRFEKDNFIYIKTDSLIQSSSLKLESSGFKDIYSNSANENLTSKEIILPDSIKSGELNLTKTLPAKILRDGNLLLEFNKLDPESISIVLIEKNIDENKIDLSDFLRPAPFSLTVEMENIETEIDGKYKILVKKGLNDTLFFKDLMVSKEKTGYGFISGEIKNKIIVEDKKNKIIILVNQLDNLKKKFVLSKNVTDKNYKIEVPPGKYLVASYIDADNNNLYTTGKYWNMKDFFSEKASFINDTIVVRKNWESSGFDLDFTSH